MSIKDQIRNRQMALKGYLMMPNSNMYSQQMIQLQIEIDDLKKQLKAKK